MVVAGCGSTGAGSGPTPRAITLTAKNDGETETVRVGTDISVELAGVENFTWSIPATSDTAVVKPTAGIAGGDGSATADFTAVGAGQATLSAVDNPKCFPVCALPPAGGWRVTIIVR